MKSFDKNIEQWLNLLQNSIEEHWLLVMQAFPTALETPLKPFFKKSGPESVFQFYKSGQIRKLGMMQSYLNEY